MDTGINPAHVEAVLDALDFRPRPEFSNEEEILEAREWADYKAIRIFEELPEGASRATAVAALRHMLPGLAPNRAGRAVDAVIRRAAKSPTFPQVAPHPTETWGLVELTEPTPEQARSRRKAISMYLEKRAERPVSIPQHEPEVAEAVAEAAPTNDELAEWVHRLHEFDGSHEARAALLRLRLGMVPTDKSGGLLRTVDYDPGAKQSAPTWLVKGLFPDRGLGMLVGESQSGKSFLAVHAAVCVARGLPFFGKRTKPGAVLYIAAEGGSSVLPRIKAADEALGGTLPDNHILRAGSAPLARAPIKVMTETPNLSRDGDGAALARTVRAAARECDAAGYQLSFVVLDTLHAAMCGGDEQSAADTGHALKPLREAVEELGLFVLVVHHFGKDLERGARGSSALRAAVDTEIELRVPGYDGAKAKPAGVARRGQLIKQRDGDVGEHFHYHLNINELGRDEEGDAWTTCTVVPCEAPAAPGELKGKWDVRLKRAVEAAVAEGESERVAMKVLRGYFNNAGPADETEGARWKGFTRALEKARDAGTIETDSCGEWIWFSNAARDTGQQDTP